MKTIVKVVLIFIISLLDFEGNAQNKSAFKAKEIYKTKSLIITQVSKNSFKHTSFKQTDDFGYVPCNGLVVRNKGETIVFDTPTTDETAEELIKWLKTVLNCKINAVIPTHFHDDCLGGLKAFHEQGIPSFANFKTIELAKENEMTVPQNGFADTLILKVGNKKTITKYFGEGHTKDNVVAYFPSEKVMFGGCLIKEIGASKGYLGDATIADWSNTVQKVKKEYPNVQIVIPGHGLHGSNKLLDYTIDLFRIQ